jgi:hypothetical protein
MSLFLALWEGGESRVEIERDPQGLVPTAQMSFSVPELRQSRHHHTLSTNTNKHQPLKVNMKAKRIASSLHVQFFISLLFTVLV